MHDMSMCMNQLTEQRTYEDKNLNGGGEVPVGLLSDEALLVLQLSPLGRWAAVPPGRCARRIQEIQPEVRC